MMINVKKILIGILYVCLFFVLTFAVSSCVYSASFSNVQDDVNSASSNSVITLENTTYTSDGNYIRIDKNLTIQGPSGKYATLDGDSKSRIVLVDFDSIVTFKRIIFINGYPGAGSGAAIATRSKITVDDCIFRNNKGESGAGIFLSSNAEHSTITNSRFISNAANVPGEDDWVEGGAIDIHANYTTISTCYFGSNSANDVGGAINFASGTIGHKISNSNFTSNYAENGGAIRIIGSKLAIENCQFTNNTARTSEGGAIRIQSSEINITGSNFANNIAKLHGGAIYSGGNASTNLTIKSSTFSNNNANQGGGIYSNRTLTINSSTIQNNKATNQGGGIYTNVGNTIISSSKFTSNTAKSGAGIYSNGSLRISSSTLKSNKATNDGGALYINGSSANIVSSKFNENSAKYGGAIYTSRPTTLSSVALTKNKASSDGGGIYSKSTLNMTGGSIKSNIATYGSGIFNTATLRLSKVSLASNVAKLIGVGLSTPASVGQGKKLTIKTYVLKGDNIENSIYSKTNTIVKQILYVLTINYP
ncbi:putative outer membrane protein pmp20 precursor [Methanobrevibacter cuticularis]|uniref:Putative outer membrane protein pmp20 n=1 Tax=Methanobrevibacter cuticularis TaxID=47311 RepID=A0A166CP72_9EURY|nr:right-handed parallel beta-helix repeat-containing protein [Methanobrevibacter cuticularis]KZX14713.1 putative outer membrane protein pmp20 precursor [Methanobrevibacter cuticularis]